MKNAFMKRKVHNRVKAVALTLAVSAVVGGCGTNTKQPEQPQMAYEAGTLNMGTGSEGSIIHQAGWKVSDIISNTVPGIYVMVEVSKGAMINADNVTDGSMDLALIPADVAYDAANGRNLFADEKMEDLRVLGACYQEVSGWIAPKTAGLTKTEDLIGKIISSGPTASATELASEDVFDIMGIEEGNTEIYSDSIFSSVRHLREGTADASHAFSIVPNAAHESLANEMETVILSYTNEHLDQIVAQEPWYFKTEIPARTYQGQEKAVSTFGRKMLLCADADLDDDLAYEIARALDLNGPVYTADSRFMAAISDKDFLCKEIPVPLHDGVKRYYKEVGYLTE